MQRKESPTIDYKVWVMSQADGEIEEYRELIRKSSIIDAIVSAQNNIVSSIELLEDLCMPKETVTHFRERAQAMAIDELKKSVRSYHLADYIKNLPPIPLAKKEKEITLAVRLSEVLEIPGPEIVRTILSETRPAKMEQWLYRYTQNGTVTLEEAEELAQEFHLK